jgi:hypothetical protein
VSLIARRTVASPLVRTGAADADAGVEHERGGFGAIIIGDEILSGNALTRRPAQSLLLLGVTLALLTHVPVLGLLTPSLAALAYVHYCLEALRGLRQGAVVTVIGELPTVKEAI